MLFAESPLITQLSEELDAITDAQIARAESKLTKLSDSDKSVGVVADKLTQKLYVLAGQYHVTIAQEAIASQQAMSDEDEQAHKQAGVKADSLEDVLRELFWYMVRSELNLWGNVTLSMREAWMIVEPDAAGSIVNGGNLIDILRKMSRAVNRDEES